MKLLSWVVTSGAVSLGVIDQSSSGELKATTQVLATARSTQYGFQHSSLRI